MTKDNEKISKSKLKILSQKDFESKISAIVREKSPITMIDAIVLYCEKNNVEIETAAALVTAQMKSKLEKEAISQRMVESKGAKLPIGD
jgi:hypothetical protein